jgi:hypothetical protein
VTIEVGVNTGIAAPVNGLAFETVDEVSPWVPA